MLTKLPANIRLWSAVTCTGVILACSAGVAEPLTAANAWVRAPAPGQTVAGAYMDLASDGGATLVGAASPAAAGAELHSMTVEAGVMKMRPVESIVVPPGKSVTLAPGGLHVMLMGLRRPLKPGDKVPIVLSVRRGSSITEVRIEAEVRTAPAQAPHHH